MHLGSVSRTEVTQNVTPHSHSVPALLYCLSVHISLDMFLCCMPGLKIYECPVLRSTRKMPREVCRSPGAVGAPQACSNSDFPGGTSLSRVY